MPLPAVHPLVWSVSTLGWPAAGLEEWMDLCRRWGLAEIELRVLEGSLAIPSVLARRFGHPNELAAWLQTQPARIGVFSTGLKLAVDDPAQRGELQACAPWAEAAGVRWLRVFDQVGAARPWTPQEWAIAGEQFRWWRNLRAAHRWQVELIVEAHHAWFAPDVYCRACELLGQNVPLIFDLGHAIRGLGPDGALAAWDRLADHCPRVHFKDLKAAGSPGSRHCVPGEGVAPLGDFLARCRVQARPPVITLEWERLWEPALPDLEIALAALQQRFR